MKIAVFASFKLGYLLFETLKEIEARFPRRLNHVGLATDDPANIYSRISAKRRIWRLFPQRVRVELERVMVESALTFGVPCYTGEVKTEYFRRLLSEWRPDAMIVCVFGQMLDDLIIGYPAYGIYNIHPSDLAGGNGAGPRPYQDLIDRDAETSRVTIHQLTVDVEGGPILGQSPPVCVRNREDRVPGDILVLNDRMASPIDRMAALLASELVWKKEGGWIAPVEKIDFESAFSAKEKERLIEPIADERPKEVLPRPDPETEALLESLF